MISYLRHPIPLYQPSKDIDNPFLINSYFFLIIIMALNCKNIIVTAIKLTEPTFLEYLQ